MMTILKRIFLGLALVYGGICVLLYAAQNSIIYAPDYGGRQITQTPADLNLAFEDVILTTDGGDDIHGWYIPHPDAKTVTLFFHGNAGNLSLRLKTIKRWHDLGVSFFMVDYPGYGQSTGQPSEESTYEAARTAWRYLRETKDYVPEQILIFGRSLGGAVATQLATEVQARGLLLESTFASVPDLAAQRYPWLPVRWLARTRYESIQKIPDITYPKLLIHSPDDRIIPINHSRELYAAASEPKELFIIRGDHNNGPSATEPEYSARLASFLTQLER